VTFPGTVEDCRTFWPPEFGEEGCECTVCVTAESHNTGTLTIQQAIDEVRVKGGIVCLGPGIFNVPEQPLIVKDARSVRIRGKGWRTVIAHTGSGPTMAVSGTIGLTLENFTMLTARGGSGTADLALQNSADVCVQECYFIHIGGDARSKAAIGLSGVLLRTRIRENVFFSAAGIANTGASAENDERPSPLLTLDFRCEGNVLLCARHGIRLHEFCLHLGETVVTRNSINGTRDGGLVLTGAVRADVWGGSRLDVVGNTCRGDGDGIVVGTDEARIDGNDVGPESEKRTGRGIVIERGFSEKQLSRLQITTNRIHDLQGHAIHLRAPLRSAIIKQNQIERINGGGIIMDAESFAEHVVIENNQLMQVVNLADAIRAQLSAIHVARARDVDVSGNMLRDVGANTVRAASLAGIQLLACTRARVAGNRVVNFGPNEKFTGEIEAIAVSGPYNSVEIIDNTMRRREDPNDDRQSKWRAVRIGPFGKKLPGSFIVGTALVIHAKTVEAVLTETSAVIHAISTQAVALRGNVIFAFGSEPALLIMTTGPLAISAIAQLCSRNQSFLR
jgi:Right handed beta helix region